MKRKRKKMLAHPLRLRKKPKSLKSISMTGVKWRSLLRAEEDSRQQTRGSHLKAGRINAYGVTTKTCVVS